MLGPTSVRQVPACRAPGAPPELSGFTALLGRARLGTAILAILPFTPDVQFTNICDISEMTSFAPDWLVRPRPGRRTTRSIRRHEWCFATFPRHWGASAATATAVVVDAQLRDLAGLKRQGGFPLRRSARQAKTGLPAGV